jgi:hypothetical protein
VHAVTLSMATLTGICLTKAWQSGASWLTVPTLT